MRVRTTTLLFIKIPYESQKVAREKPPSRLEVFLCDRKENVMDIAELINYLLTPVAQVALIIGIAEVIKRVGCPSRWIPLIDLGFGLLSGILVYGINLKYGIPIGIVVGLALGLSACGLFSGIKNTFEREEIEE